MNKEQLLELFDVLASFRVIKNRQEVMDAGAMVYEKLPHILKYKKNDFVPYDELWQKYSEFRDSFTTVWAYAVDDRHSKAYFTLEVIKFNVSANQLLLMVGKKIPDQLDAEFKLSTGQVMIRRAITEICQKDIQALEEQALTIKDEENLREFKLRLTSVIKAYHKGTTFKSKDSLCGAVSFQNLIANRNVTIADIQREMSEFIDKRLGNETDPVKSKLIGYMIKEHDKPKYANKPFLTKETRDKIEIKERTMTSQRKYKLK